MRLPDDDERPGLTPTVMSAIVAVTLFVAAILAVVLMINSDHKSGGNHTASVSQNGRPTPRPASSGSSYPDIDELLSGSKLTPDDLSFWNLYPPTTATPPAATPEPVKTPTVSQNDPSTDGKHTLIRYSDGKEEWVLISPYLPKNNYDFTKLVCQSQLMKYYENGKQTSFVGVDVSKAQDYIDFVKVKKAGIDFVMIRVGARGYGTGQLIVDEYFNDNMKRAKDAGLNVGVYFYSQAISTDEAIEEANLVLENLSEYQIEYPVAFDMELVENDTARTDTLSKTERTAIAKAFLDTIEDAGYKTVIYGNKQWLIKAVDMSKLTAYDVWLAQEADIPDYPYKFTMWQYSKKGSIDGIAGYVDLNISFIDYAGK